MTDLYYVVMCTRRSDPGHSVEYSGIRWSMDQEADATDEYDEALSDSDIMDVWIREVCPW